MRSDKSDAPALLRYVPRAHVLCPELGAKGPVERRERRARTRSPVSEANKVS